MSDGPILRRVRGLLDAGRPADALAALLQSARSDDPDALAELAQWRIAGTIIERDLAEARTLLDRAGRAGHGAAAHLHAAFQAAGTGGAADFAGAVANLEALAPASETARRQLALLGAMALQADGSPADQRPWEVLSRAPRAAVQRQFLTPAECRYLIDAGSPFLQASVVVEPATGRMIPNPIRRSDAAMFGVHLEDLVVNAINRRIAHATGTTPPQGEPLQLLRYGPGDEYRDHLDILPNEANQRILTVILYLSDDYDGGETRFPRVGLTFRGACGDALAFSNCTPDGRPDPLSVHAGAPVRQGEKVIATRWIRRGPFVYPPPTPLLADSS